MNPAYDEMSSPNEDPAVAEKQVAASEDGGSASGLSLTNGVARDYELKCALSESFVGALLHHSQFAGLFSQQLHARGVRTLFTTGDDMIDPADRIGFGPYQWQLFVLSGLGWLVDSESCFDTPGTRVEVTNM